MGRRVTLFSFLSLPCPARWGRTPHWMPFRATIVLGGGLGKGHEGKSFLEASGSSGHGGPGKRRFQGQPSACLHRAAGRVAAGPQPRPGGEGPEGGGFVGDGGASWSFCRGPFPVRGGPRPPWVPWRATRVLVGGRGKGHEGKSFLGASGSPGHGGLGRAVGSGARWVQGSGGCVTNGSATGREEEQRSPPFRRCLPLSGGREGWVVGRGERALGGYGAPPHWGGWGAKPSHGKSLDGVPSVASTLEGWVNGRPPQAGQRGRPPPPRSRWRDGASFPYFPRSGVPFFAYDDRGFYARAHVRVVVFLKI